MPRFTHLHLHTHYSLLDGLTKPSALISRVRELGMDSVAVTDHGNMYGAIEFYKEAKANGIKPIIGCEFYVAERDMYDKSLKGNDTFHLTLLAQNETGYKNLCKLVTEANLKGFYYKPRIDFSLLSKHSEGLICLSGCLGGQLSQLLLKNASTAAVALSRAYQELFGDRYYIEIQRHENNEDQCKVTPRLIALAQKLKIPMVATGDSHYLCKDDAHTHDVLLAIQTGKKTDDKDRMTMAEDDFSVASPEEMLAKFSDIPEAVENSAKIADRCNLEIELGHTRLPRFDIPALYSDANKYLLSLCEHAMHDRQLGSIENLERVNYEINIIAKTGFAAYMLIVWDLVRWAKEHGIMVGPGRGSAAGSLIAYLLGITNIDPIKHGLLFERFMNPDRISMPDIDMDFEDRRRGEVIQYARQKYGDDHVSQIITFGTMFARSAVRDAGRAMGVNLSTCDRIAKEIPFGMSLADAISNVGEMRREYEAGDNTELLDVAMNLEGVVRHAGTHACGVVISDKPLVDYMPLQNSSRDDTSIVSQYDMDCIGDLGLLKMDFLGLRNLTVIGDTVKLVKEQMGVDIDVDALPEGDPLTYKLLQMGKTTAVFQLESGGMKKYLKELVPTELNDITAMVSLYRPGPMELIPEYVARKHGRTKVEYLHPKLEPILKDTYGIMIYQEQLMAACRALAGFTLAEADILRKAVGKKNAKLLADQEGKFKDGCRKNGIDRATTDKFWALIEPFNKYGFNKSHGVSYATIAYQTAYLKAHYPLQFMVAEMNSDDDIERVAELVSEMSDIGLVLAPPDINESGDRFVGAGKIIRFALSTIKGVNSKVTEAILEERKNGKFNDFKNLVRRMNKFNPNKKTLELLAKAGAFDSFDMARSTVVEAAEQLATYSKEADVSILPELVLPEVKKETTGQKLAWEKELLGLYASSNPAKNYYELVRKQGTIEISQLPEAKGDFIKIGGVISDFRKTITKNGKTLYFIRVHDMSGSLEVPIFAGIYTKHKDALVNNNILILSGKIDHTRDKSPFVCLGVKQIGSMVE